MTASQGDRRGNHSSERIVKIDLCFNKKQILKFHTNLCEYPNFTFTTFLIFRYEDRMTCDRINICPLKEVLVDKVKKDSNRDIL